MWMIRRLVAVACLLGMVSAYAVDTDEGKAVIFPQLGHSDSVTALAVSSDGNTIVSGSKDNTLKLWDVTSGREIRTIRAGNGDGISSLALSPDGHTIVTGVPQQYGTGIKKNFSGAKLWDSHTGKGKIALSSGVYGNPLTGPVAFSADGKTILIGDKEGNIHLFDSVSEKERWVLNTSSYTGIDSLAFSSDGHTIATSTFGNKVTLWSTSSGRKLFAIDGHSDTVSALAFSPDGRYLVSGSHDGTLKLWDVAMGHWLHTLQGHKGWVQAVAFSPDGRTIVSGGEDLTLKFWNSDTGRALNILGRNSGYGVNSVAFFPDGQTLISGSDAGIKFWNANTGQELHNTKMSGGVTPTHISTDGRTIFSGSSDNIKILDIETGRELANLKGHAKALEVKAVSPNGHIFVTNEIDSKDASGQDKLKGGNSVKLWDAATNRDLHILKGHKDYINVAAFSPDSLLVATGSQDKTVKLWDSSSGKLLRTMVLDSRKNIDFGGLSILTFSPNGRTILSASNFIGKDDVSVETIKLWDVSSGKLLLTLNETCIDAVFSSDSRTIISAGLNLNFWDVDSGKKLRSFGNTYDEKTSSLAISPDGNTIVTGNADNTIKLWDMSSGKILKTLIGHEGDVTQVAFSQDGREVVSNGADGTVRRWDVATGKEIIQFVNFKDGEWVTITPEGYFASSNHGSEHLNIRIDNKVYGVDQFYDVFYRPDIVQAKLKGEDITDLITITIDQALKNPPPTLSFTQVPSSTKSNTEKVCYKAVANGGGIGEVRLFQNGKLIKSDGFYRETVAKDRNGDASIKLASMNSAAISRALKLTKAAQKSEPPMESKSKGDEYSECQEIDTIPGENEISVAAFNANNTIQSTLKTVSFKADRKAEAPQLYVLGIGINKYQSAENNLSYAVKDATDFRNMIQDKAKGLFNPQSIHIEGLSDEQATKEGIQKAIQNISAKVKPWDSFILSVASHGYLQDNQYYIVTADFDGAINTDKMISSNEIVNMSKNIKSLSQLLIFDTCHAGGVDNLISDLYDARMSVMANKMGLHIYASAGSTQTALDGYQGNGLFTHALLDSMKAGSTTDSNHDHKVSVAELGAQAKQETIEISKKLGFPQSPNIINFGKDNALFNVK